MTVASTDCVISYAAVISGVPLAVPFSVFAVDELDVYTPTGTAVFGVDYTVKIADDFKSATVTPVASIAGLNITIVRDTNAIQPLDIQQNQRLPERSLTREFDRGVLRDQELKRGLASTLRGRPGEALNALPAVRAGGLLSFDSVGQPFITYPLTAGGINVGILPTTPPAGPGNLWLNGEPVGGYVICVTGTGT